jgi:hypothetical protein
MTEKTTTAQAHPSPRRPIPRSGAWECWWAISADGNTVSGGWRPDAGGEATEGSAYDMTMYRVQE